MQYLPPSVAAGTHPTGGREVVKAARAAVSMGTISPCHTTVLFREDTLAEQRTQALIFESPLIFDL